MQLPQQSFWRVVFVRDTLYTDPPHPVRCTPVTGRRVLDAIIDLLLTDHYGMNKATEVCDDCIVCPPISSFLSC